MSTITKEQAKDLRNAFQCWQQDYDPVEDKEQYDMFGLGMVAMDALLASLEAEAVAYMIGGHYLMHAQDPKVDNYTSAVPLYTAPPAPVVDADDNFYSWFGREWHEHYQQNQYTTAAKQMLGVMAESAWKAGRRAAMRQGAEQTNYRAIVERIAEMIHGKVTDIDLLTVTVKSMKDKLQK